MIIYDSLPKTRVNGPGLRACVWVQGCNLGCKGCWNPHTHSFDRKDNYTPEQLVDWILGLPEIEGVTFSGGEPMQQAPELWETVYRIKQAKPELSIGMFTGYNVAELDKGLYRYRFLRGRGEITPGVHHTEVIWKDRDIPGTRGWEQIPGAPFVDKATFWGLLKTQLDFVVAGRFVDSRKTTASPMVSSTNQRLLLLTSRYKESDFERQAVEVTIKPGGLIKITGFPVGVTL